MDVNQLGDLRNAVFFLECRKFGKFPFHHILDNLPVPKDDVYREDS